MAYAVAEMQVECDRPAEQEKFTHAAGKKVVYASEALRRIRRRPQPAHQQHAAHGKCCAGGAMEDGKRHCQAPFIYLQVRRQRPWGGLWCVLDHRRIDSVCRILIQFFDRVTMIKLQHRFFVIASYIITGINTRSELKPPAISYRNDTQCACRKP